MVKNISWIRRYPEFVLDGEACSNIVSCPKKFQVKQYAKIGFRIAKIDKITSWSCSVNVEVVF